jgi:hypothetical protein
MTEVLNTRVKRTTRINKDAAFWKMVPGNLAEVDRRFRSVYGLHTHAQIKEGGEPVSCVRKLLRDHIYQYLRTAIFTLIAARI